MQRRFVIGVDEAGYGPNIGPLVVATTLWSLPIDCPASEMWTLLQTVVTDSPAPGDSRLHVADSKQVYQSGSGLTRLEQGVLQFVHLLDNQVPSQQKSLSLNQLIGRLRKQLPDSFASQPWYRDCDLTLPLAQPDGFCHATQHALNFACRTAELKLETIAIEVVCPQPFNQLVAKWGNKSSLLSHTTFDLIRRIWPVGEDHVEVLADKHGGRNRYQEFLLQYFPDRFFLNERESREESRYRCGTQQFILGTRSERHLPVAVASMTAKYVRELCLELFNRYWQQRQPGLKPTRGYPQDARRFLGDITAILKTEPQLRDVLWRER